MKMRATGSPPKLAIYTDGDDSPFTSPMSNLARLRLHSDLPYIGVVGLHSGSVVPSSGISTTETVGSGDTARTYRRTNLAAHGLSYAPLIVGTITTSSGTFPVMCPPDQIEVVSDATHIFLAYDDGTPLTIDLAGTVSFEIGATNYGVDGSGAFVAPGSFGGVRITPTRVQAGSFDTNNRYLQRDAAGTFPIVVGESMSLGLGRASSAPNTHTVGMEVIYNVNGTLVHTGSNRVPFSTLPPVDDAFDADVVVCSA